jgi:predicted nuclease with RNAse H fold
MLPLGKNSLGPVPTVKQMEVLKKMAEPGVHVVEWSGSSINSNGAFLRWTETEHKSEDVNRGTVSKFVAWHWLEPIKLDWRGNTYKISATGIKRIEMGKTR